MAQRVLAKRRLLPFVKRLNPNYLAGWVHEDICRRLERFSEDVEKGLSPRLMLLMPPRSGKSELASRMFPAWHLGRHPDTVRDADVPGEAVDAAPVDLAGLADGEGGGSGHVVGGCVVHVPNYTSGSPNVNDLFSHPFAFLESRGFRGCSAASRPRVVACQRPCPAWSMSPR
jgi:hypothetical protein